MKITQLINNNGNPVANHFVIHCSDGRTVLQSYESMVAEISRHTGTIVLGPDWDYSATTLKHLKAFLGLNSSKKELQKRIDAGNIVVTDIQVS